MPTSTLIPVEEYLSGAFEPDCDYVNGELQERHVGERPHAALQFILASIFDANRAAWNVFAFPELRMEVAPDRFRVPDVTVLRRSDPVEAIVHTPPLVCIEVLSPEDRVQRTQERLKDYLEMGVEHVWLIDPISRDAWTITRDGSHTAVTDAFAVPGTPIRVGLAALFTELDERLTRG